MNLVRIAVLLLAASCSAQTSIFDVTIGKPVNAKLPDCDTSEDKPCVKSHYNDDSSAGTSSGEVFFPGDVGTVEYKELDGKVEFISGLYNTGYQNEVSSELRKKFGPPSDVSRVKYRNGFGISSTRVLYHGIARMLKSASIQGTRIWTRAELRCGRTNGSVILTKKSLVRECSNLS